MIISRQSWHYRFMMNYGSDNLNFNLKSGHKPFTTCTYIRALLGVMFNMTVFIACFTFVLGMALFGLFSMGSFAVMVATSTVPEKPTLTAVVGLVSWIVVILTVGIWLIVKVLVFLTDLFEKKASERRTKKWMKKQEEKSVFKKAMEDRKDGICTIVTFK